MAIIVMDTATMAALAIRNTGYNGLGITSAYVASIDRSGNMYIIANEMALLVKCIAIVLQRL